MVALPFPRLFALAFIGAAISIGAVTSASATTATVDPELEKQEREIERLLKNAEAEFWSLKQRLERDRNDRQQRLAQARADYEKARQTSDLMESDDRTVAEHQAAEARARYENELERALTGVDAARTALDRVEARVSKYRATLAALRRRSKGSTQKPSPAAPDSTSRTPITGAVGTGPVLYS